MLRVGDKAPEFSLISNTGNEVNLSDFKGKKVIIYFYPKDMTPGCTNQACSLRDRHEDIKNKNAVVIGISKDNQASHEKFIEKYGLPFILLCDTDHIVAEKYTCWGEKKFMGNITIGILRKSFIIDETGVVEKIFEKVDTKIHGDEVVDYLNGL